MGEGFSAIRKVDAGFKISNIGFLDETLATCLKIARRMLSTVFEWDITIVMVRPLPGVCFFPKMIRTPGALKMQTRVDLVQMVLVNGRQAVIHRIILFDNFAHDLIID